MSCGFIYCLAPLYKIYCRNSGFSKSQISEQAPLSSTSKKKIRVRFLSNTDKKIMWEFKPLQKYIDVKLGTGYLAFYNAKNISCSETKGIATYNILPQRAALYFNKIQCFCFEEQILNPEEDIAMPVYFYIDESIENDPLLKNIKEIILSYTFFKS